MNIPRETLALSLFATELGAPESGPTCNATQMAENSP
jgi:hypothetical protein